MNEPDDNDVSDDDDDDDDTFVIGVSVLYAGWKAVNDANGEDWVDVDDTSDPWFCVEDNGREVLREDDNHIVAFAATVVGEVDNIIVPWVNESIVQDAFNVVPFREVDIIVMFERLGNECPDSKIVKRIRSVPRGFDVKLEKTGLVALSRLNLFFSLDSIVHRLRVVNNDITKADNKQIKAVVFFHKLTFRVLSLFERSGLGRQSNLCGVLDVTDSSEKKQNL